MAHRVSIKAASLYTKRNPIPDYSNFSPRKAHSARGGGETGQLLSTVISMQQSYWRINSPARKQGLGTFDDDRMDIDADYRSFIGLLGQSWRIWILPIFRGLAPITISGPNPCLLRSAVLSEISISSSRGLAPPRSEPKPTTSCPSSRTAG
jgi:hypothetical protein